MKKVIAIILVAIISLSLLGCASKITSGEVINKSYTEAHTQMLLIPVVISNGKTMSTILVPYIYHYSDRWDVTIQAWDAADKKMKRATYRVTEDVYNSVDIGAEFVYDKSMQPEEPEYTRERSSE